MGGSKLTENDVYDIKYAIAEGERHKDIAKRYDVADATISKIKNSLRWKDVQIEIPLIKSKNYWSHFSPVLQDKIISLYQAGNTQEQVAELMNEYSKTLPKKIRPRLINQSMVASILQKNGVKVREKTPPYEHLRAKMKKLYKKGLSYRKIAEIVGVSDITVKRYVTGLI